MKVAIIGAGLIGTKRAEAVSRIPQWELRYICDLDLNRARECARKYGGEAASDWKSLVVQNDIDVIIVATYHDIAVPIVLAALENGKHVLCEKPLGRSQKESMAMVRMAEQSRKLLKTGFNYRHYPAFKKAHALINEGAIGPILYIRAVLGHAARPDYDKEWRTASAAGGGALLDPGIHLIDLLRHFLGELAWASALKQKSFWDIAHEDNIFLLLKTGDGRAAFMQASITEWKNTLSFDITGRDGYIRISGRGGFYGPQKLIWNRRWSWLSAEKQEEVQETYPDEDHSFYDELIEFKNAISENRQPMGSGYDGLAAAKIIDAIYGHVVENGEVKLS